MVGDARRFGRADALDEQWRIFARAIATPHPVSLYHRGTWGPSAAETLAAPAGGWHEPESRRPDCRLGGGRVTIAGVLPSIPSTTYPPIPMGPLQPRPFGSNGRA